jgi:4-diphosphocytidyl-2-C-methyl-D-erythritol kinase
VSPTCYHFPSPAKLNLFLHINGRRADGYHELQTLFQFLNYGDEIEIVPNRTGKIKLVTPFHDVPEEDNLIIRAANLLKKTALQSKNSAQILLLGAQIKVTKVIPMGGGLGGGSSNAATILLALNKLWQLHFSMTKLIELGISLGADVPIFIHGNAAFASGIGEQLSPAFPTEYWYLVTKPNCSISTADVFNSADLPRNTAKLPLTQIDIENCHNDCQTVVVKHYPEVANLLAWLLEYAPSRMTGTGACIFSRFNSQAEALQVQEKLPKEITAFIAKGANESPLMAAIKSL